MQGPLAHYHIIIIIIPQVEDSISPGLPVIQPATKGIAKEHPEVDTDLSEPTTEEPIPDQGGDEE